MQESAGALSIRLAADAASVPGARRFVVDGLATWGRQHLAETAELVASELAGNAALHAGARFMYVSLAPQEDGGVRLGVEDDGPVASEAVHAPATATTPAGWEEGTTGRGLAIVAMLAADWGVEVTATGKRVWAHVADGETVHDVRPPRRVAVPATSTVVDELPPGWVLVRLQECPVELSLRQDRHLDELVRELQLLSSQTGSAESRELAEQIRGLLVSPTHARLTGRRAAEQARAQGREVVDIQMAMPREFHVLVGRLHEAVTRADALCEQDRLLALASPPDLRSLRAWMTHEITAQAAGGAAPVPWPEWERRRAGKQTRA